MKRLIALVLCAVISCLLCLNSVAKTGEEIQAQALADNKSELEAVQKTIETNNQNPENRQINIDNLAFQKAYKLYFLTDGDIIEAYDNKKSFGANITDKYAWIIPYTDSTDALEVVRSENSETGWAIRVDTDFDTKVAENFFDVDASYLGILNVILKTFPDFDASTLRYCSATQFKCRMMYFTYNNEEYIIPYFTTPSESVVTAKVYKAADFIEAARKYVKQTEASVQSTDSPRFDKIFIVYIIGGSIVVALFAVLVIMKNKKNKKDDNE